MQSPDPTDPDPAIRFLASRIDFERATTVPYSQRNFRLDRMRSLLARLGDPQDQLSIVHVAGTKGKGSTAATIASILQASGKRTGLYSSPHLDRLEERLMVDGRECPHAELIALIERIRPVIEAMDAEPCDDPGLSPRPTYFEIVTALAFLRFVDQRVDAAVLEVGMGGRLDSTNVCHPLVSVITSISFDHTQQLGKTLAAIAGEKAGIIKPRVPVVSGVLADEPRGVIEQVASSLASPCVQLGRDFGYHYHPARELQRADRAARMDYHDHLPGGFGKLQELALRLLGDHQAANAAVAIAAVGELRRQGWKISESDIRAGLNQVRWPARIELLRRQPAIVLDAAHNVASIEALVRVLCESFTCPRRILVFATTRDKDARGMLTALLPHFQHVIFTRYQHNPRGTAAEDLAALAAQVCPESSWEIAADPPAAWQRTRQMARAEDLVCIAGSFFIAAEMRSAMAASPIE